MEEFIKISEAARRLGVHPQTLRNWEKSGQLKAVRFHAKGHRMYHESDLLKLLHQFSEGISPSLKWAGGISAEEPPEEFYCKFRDKFSTDLWKKECNGVKVQMNKFGALLISRPAGKDAWLSFQASLRSMPKNEKITLDFAGVSVLTPSWMDEFLTPLKEKFKIVTYKNFQAPVIKETLNFLDNLHNSKSSDTL